MVLAQKQTYRPMEQNREHRMDPQMYGQLIFNKAGKNIQWNMDNLFKTSGAGKTGQRHAEE